jgi:hypothetical protein
MKRNSLSAAFPGTVSPSIACPGQNITITWDVSSINEGCDSDPATCKRDPLTVEASATGGMSFKQSPAAISGSYNGVASGTEDIIISIHAKDKDQDLGTSTAKVNILAPGEMLPFDGTCEGFCDGEKAGWREMKVNFGESTLSNLIAIKRIKNTTSTSIEYTVYYENGTYATVNLSANQTSSDFTSRISKITAKTKGAETLSSNCATGKAPSAITLTVYYGCL